MKTYEVTYWRGNPQLAGGGYERTREIEARDIRSARAWAKKMADGCIYGTMDIISVKEKRSA